MEKTIYGVATIRKPCIVTPPAELDVNQYMKRLEDIITQLSVLNMKDIAVQRIDLLEREVNTVISAQTTL